MLFNSPSNEFSILGCLSMVVFNTLGQDALNRWAFLLFLDSRILAGESVWAMQSNSGERAVAHRKDPPAGTSSSLSKKGPPPSRLRADSDDYELTLSFDDLSYWERIVSLGVVSEFEGDHHFLSFMGFQWKNYHNWYRRSVQLLVLASLFAMFCSVKLCFVCEQDIAPLCISHFAITLSLLFRLACVAFCTQAVSEDFQCRTLALLPIGVTLIGLTTVRGIR